MRKWISLLLAVLLVCSLPMTAMAVAVEVDAAKGDVTIKDTQVTHYDENSVFQESNHDGEVIVKNSKDTSHKVSIDMDGVAEDNSNSEVPDSVTVKGDDGDVNINGGVSASGGAEVIVNGNVSNENGNGVSASNGAKVTVTGDVSGGAYIHVDEYGETVVVGSAGIEATFGSHVEVGGDVTGGSATGDDSAVGGSAVFAEGSTVKVDGSAIGGNAEGDYADGGSAVLANGSTVKVAGSAIGGAAKGDLNAVGGDAVFATDSEVIVDSSATGGDAEGDYAYGGDAVFAEGSTVKVAGSAIGGNAEGDYADGGSAVLANGSTVKVAGSAIGGAAAGEDAHGGIGVWMSSDAEITVGGDAIGGESTGGKEAMPDGYIMPSGNGVYIDVNPMEPGSLTVKGEVSGSGDSADIRVDAWTYIIPEDPDPDDDSYPEPVEVDLGVEAVPDISVGNYDSIEISDSFTEEEARQIVGSIKVTNRPAASSSDDVTVKRSSGTARNGYYMGHIWRGGYITRTLFKVENGAGMKPIWEETIENGTLTITCENEPVILTTWLEGLKQLQKLGVARIVVKTENCETELVIADLIAMNGTEYVLTQKDDTATLTVDGKEAEI